MNGRLAPAVTLGAYRSRQQLRRQAVTRAKGRSNRPGSKLGICQRQEMSITLERDEETLASLPSGPGARGGHMPIELSGKRDCPIGRIALSSPHENL